VALYLLKRKISEASGPDRLLGVFRTRDEARRARRRYLDPIVRGEVVDPWARQAFRETISVERDVVIVCDVRLAGIRPTTDPVFVVSSYAEGFGQIVRQFEAICGTRSRAATTAKSLEKRHRSGFNFSCTVDAVEVDTLLADRRDA
jgi:hypothetical protein